MAPSCRFIWFPSVSSPSPYVTHVTRSAHHSCRRRVERTEGNELWGERQAVEPSSVDCDGWCLVSLSPFLTSWLDPSSFVHHPSHVVPPSSSDRTVGASPLPTHLATPSAALSLGLFVASLFGLVHRRLIPFLPHSRLHSPVTLRSCRVATPSVPLPLHPLRGTNEWTERAREWRGKGWRHGSG